MILRFIMCVKMTQERVSDCSFQSSLGSVPFPFYIQLMVIAHLKLTSSLRNIQCHVPHESFGLHKVYPIQGLTYLLQQQFWFCVLFKHLCVFTYSSADPFWVKGCLVPWILQQRIDFLFVMTIHDWTESNVFFKLWWFMHKHERKNICANVISLDMQMSFKIIYVENIESQRYVYCT